MSTVAPSPAAVPRPASRSRLRGFWRSSIGLKIIMAVTGVILSVFVLGHMAGNLQAFQGAEAINAYARFLRVEPALLWTVRLGLLAAVALHIWAFLVLTRENQRARPEGLLVLLAERATPAGLMRQNQGARPEGYRARSYKESSYASRSMLLTGPFLLAFIVYHILHMTIGTVHPDFREGDVYHNLIIGLRTPFALGFYLLAMAALALHLWHGVWSMFQTLGVSQARYRSFGRRFATIFTLVVVLGFAAVPLAVLARIL